MKDEYEVRQQARSPYRHFAMPTTSKDKGFSERGRPATQCRSPHLWCSCREPERERPVAYKMWFRIPGTYGPDEPEVRNEGPPMIASTAPGRSLVFPKERIADSCRRDGDLPDSLTASGRIERIARGRNGLREGETTPQQMYVGAFTSRC